MVDQDETTLIGTLLAKVLVMGITSGPQLWEAVVVAVLVDVVEVQ